MNCLRWFGHIRRRPSNALVKRIGGWQSDVKSKGSHLKTWMSVIESDVGQLAIQQNMLLDRGKC